LTNKNIKTLKWFLFAGAIYFALVALAHMLGIKIPGLFVFYNVPSYAYQDRIISFFAFGWSIFFFTAFLNPIKNIDLIKAILFAGFGAIAGLIIINSFTDFYILSPNIQPSVFWLQTLGLSAYLGGLIFFYRRIL